MRLIIGKILVLTGVISLGSGIAYIAFKRMPPDGRVSDATADPGTNSPADLARVADLSQAAPPAAPPEGQGDIESPFALSEPIDEQSQVAAPADETTGFLFESPEAAVLDGAAATEDADAEAAVAGDTATASEAAAAGEIGQPLTPVSFTADQESKPKVAEAIFFSPGMPRHDQSASLAASDAAGVGDAVSADSTDDAIVVPQAVPDVTAVTQSNTPTIAPANLSFTPSNRSNPIRDPLLASTARGAAPPVLTQASASQESDEVTAEPFFPPLAEPTADPDPDSASAATDELAISPATPSAQPPGSDAATEPSASRGEPADDDQPFMRSLEAAEPEEPAPAAASAPADSENPFQALEPAETETPAPSSEPTPPVSPPAPLRMKTPERSISQPTASPRAPINPMNVPVTDENPFGPAPVATPTPTPTPTPAPVPEPAPAAAPARPQQDRRLQDSSPFDAPPAAQETSTPVPTPAQTPADSGTAEPANPFSPAPAIPPFPDDRPVTPEPTPVPLPVEPSPFSPDTDSARPEPDLQPEPESQPQPEAFTPVPELPRSPLPLSTPERSVETQRMPRPVQQPDRSRGSGEPFPVERGGSPARIRSAVPQSDELPPFPIGNETLADPDAAEFDARTLPPFEEMPVPAESDSTGRPFPERTPGSGLPRPTERLRPQLTIEKKAPESATIGIPHDYRIMVSNEGDTVAREVIVEDELNGAAELVSSNPPAEYDRTTGQLIWNIDELQPDETRDIIVRVRPTGEGMLAGTATVRFRTEVRSATLIRAPRLQLEVNGPEQVRVGDDVGLQFVIRNSGSGDAAGVLLRSVLPEALRHPEGADLEYEIDLLRAGEEQVVDLTAVAAEPGRPVRISAELSAAGMSAVMARNNLTIIGSQITIERLGPGRRFVGRPARFQNVIVNQTDFEAADVIVTEDVPEGMRVLSVGAGGEYNPKTRRITWNIRRIDAGSQTVLDVELQPEITGRMESVIEVLEKAGFRSRAAENTAVEVEGLHNVTADITGENQPVAVGERFGFTVMIENRGTAVARNVELTVQVPPGLQVLAAGTRELPGRLLAGNVVRYSVLRTLKPGERLPFQLTLQGREAVRNAVVQAQLKYDEMTQPLILSESVTVFDDQP